MTQFPDDWKAEGYLEYSPSRFDPATDVEKCLDCGTEIRQIVGGPVYTVYECPGCNCLVYVR